MRKQQDAIAKERRGQVGTGERSEKIRTYNFKENRITDHRINFTMHQLTNALDGDLDELIARARGALRRPRSCKQATESAEASRRPESRDACSSARNDAARRLAAAGIDGGRRQA